MNPVYHRTRMTRIFTDLRLTESNITPQSTQIAQSMAAVVFASFALWYGKKFNNELVRNPYELTLLEFVSVRFSSLFFSGSFMKMAVDATQ